MKTRVLTVMMCVMAVVNVASADLVQGINIDFVTIGNPGNTADTQVMSIDGTTGYGAVGYNYRIGKYEVTNAQWNAFTAAAGAPTGNDGGYDYPAEFTGAQQPTNNVSWYEGLQFCNYLTSGDKSKGVYQFSGNNAYPGDFLGIGINDRAVAQAAYGTIYFLPTEDEWYKAAYHKNDGVTGHYWLYPTQSNSDPSNDLINPDPGNNANFYQDGYTIGSPDYLTAVGEFENSDSAYGTFDQGGNVWEWNESLGWWDSFRGLRGGSYGGGGGDVLSLASSYRGSNPPDAGYYYGVGFRVASVPEPATLLLLGLSGLGLLRKRRG